MSQVLGVAALSVGVFLVWSAVADRSPTDTIESVLGGDQARPGRAAAPPTRGRIP